VLLLDDQRAQCANSRHGDHQKGQQRYIRAHPADIHPNAPRLTSSKSKHLKEKF
jgi:hypothetical protein